MADRPDFSFVRKPRWLVGHIIALSAIVLFVNLGMWQLRRHDERSALDATLAARADEAPFTLDEAVAVAPEALDYRRVTAVGTFDPDEETVLLARSFRSRPGHNVLTPLVLADGSAVMVNRGWVPMDITGPPVAEAAPPPGEVAVTGVARKAETGGRYGSVVAEAGRVEGIDRVDLDRISSRSLYRLQPFYLQLLSPEPAAGLPLLLDAPEPGGGPPHLSYAVQWFAFTAVVAVGYPILLRSTARREAS